MAALTPFVASFLGMKNILNADIAAVATGQISRA